MKEESPSMSESLTTSKHNEELDAMVKAAADHTWTIDEILGLALETKDYINEFSARELDTLILDMTYVLAFEKRNDRNGKHWKHITLDCETQALICKLAEFEMCLNRLEERRLEMTLTAAAERERLEKRKRAVLTRGWRRVERLGRRLSRRVYEWKQLRAYRKHSEEPSLYEEDKVVGMDQSRSERGNELTGLHGEETGATIFNEISW